MSLKDKLRHWLDQWVGATEITPIPEGISQLMESDKDPRAHQRVSSSPAQSQTLQMRDVFFLNPRTKALTPKDTVALYLSEREAIVVRDPSSGEIDRLIPLKHAQELVPLWGRFGENGEESVALYDSQSGYFRIWDALDHPTPQHEFLFGPPGLGWLPLVGDWTGQGRDGIGLYDPVTSTFLLKDTLEGGEPDRVFMFGVPGKKWKPVVGDWDGDGRSGIGFFVANESIFYLKNGLEGGEHDLEVRLSIQNAGLIPLSGDWEGQGRDTVGLFDPIEHVFHLGISGSDEAIWAYFRFGAPNTSGIPLRMQFSFSEKPANVGRPE
jgi:hypothetical protein